MASEAMRLLFDEVIEAVRQTAAIERQVEKTLAYVIQVQGELIDRNNDLLAARARIVELEEALRPIAAFADQYDKYEDIAGVSTRVGLLRGARRALGPRR